MLSTLASSLASRLRALASRPGASVAGAVVAGAVLVRVLVGLRTRSARSRELATGTLVIVGASQGVGASLARLLGRTYPRAQLVLIARTGTLLAALKADIDGGGGGAPRPGACCVFVADATDGHALLRVARAVGAPPAAVVSCAGVGTWRSSMEEDASPEATARCLGSPLLSMLHAAHAFLPGMVRAGRGTLLALQSPASRAPWPGATAYAAARWGLRGALEALRADCDASAPGVRIGEVVLTEVSDSAYFANNPDSRARLPWVAPLFGRLSSHDAAVAVLDALVSGRETTTAPSVLRGALATLPLPGAAHAFRALLVATGWRRGPTTVLAA